MSDTPMTNGDVLDERQAVYNDAMADQTKQRDSIRAKLMTALQEHACWQIEYETRGAGQTKRLPELAQNAVRSALVVQDAEAMGHAKGLTSLLSDLVAAEAEWNAASEKVLAEQREKATEAARVTAAAAAKSKK